MALRTVTSVLAAHTRCRRCRRTGATCDFVPRANAARPWSPGPYPSHTCTELWRSEVNQRLKALEMENAQLAALVAQHGRSTERRRSPSAPSHMPIQQEAPPGRAPPSFTDAANGRGRGLDLELDERERATPDLEPGYSGVLSALERLKRELPGHIAGDEAWAPPVVCRLWES